MSLFVCGNIQICKLKKLLFHANGPFTITSAPAKRV